MALKEFWALVRQPQLLVLLLVGPVLIMTIFGLSLDVENILRPRALVVVEPGSEGAELFQQCREEFTDRTQFVGTTDDPVAARQRLLRGEVDAVIVIPSAPLETCRVEVPYSDGMDARVSAGGEVSRVRDISTEDLLRTVAVAATVGGTDQA